MDDPLAWRVPSEAWADDYERGRPGWPHAVVDLVEGETVLDLGAGTGKLTRELIPAFERVIAVEPAASMRRVLGSFATDVRDGSAESIPLADDSVDAVFVAEAFHRFAAPDAVAEIARVLRPRGPLVLLWNVPAGPWAPSTEAAEALLSERLPPGELDYDPFDLGGPRRELGLERTVFPNPQTLDRDGLVSFYASMGWLAELPEGERLPLLTDVRSLLHSDEYHRRWETQVYLDFDP